MLNRWTRPLLTLMFVLVVCVLVASVASACPMCKDSTGQVTASGFANDTSSGAVSNGFGHSVYLMLGGFLGTVALITFNLFKGGRK
jgi:hypothetical protein